MNWCSIPTTSSAPSATATQATNPGFVTVYPVDPMPTASNLNLERAGQTIPNAVVATLSGAGFRVYSQQGAHGVVDSSGYFTA